MAILFLVLKLRISCSVYCFSYAKKFQRHTIQKSCFLGLCHGKSMKAKFWNKRQRFSEWLHQVGSWGFWQPSENRSVIQHFLCLWWLHMQLRLSVDHWTYRNTVFWAYSTIFQNPRLDVCSHSLKLWVVKKKKDIQKSFQIPLHNNNNNTASTSGRILLFFWNADSVTSKEVEPPDIFLDIFLRLMSP